MAPFVFAILAGLFWGVGELAAKSALKSGEVGPMTAIAVRATVALPVIWVAWLAASRGWLEPIGVQAAREPATWTEASAATWAKLVLGAGVSAGALGLAFFYLGLSTGDVSKVKPIAFALAPTFAAAGAFLVLGEEFTAKKLLGLLLIVGGILVLTLPERAPG
jgi:transporter family protein